ncbi:MAG: hypothetical protein ABI691_24940 [Ginsengibacter sp.]
MKKHTSVELKDGIKNNVHESRKEWMLWLMERAGKKNSNNKDWQFWQQHNKPLEITGQQMFDEKLLYIHQNLPTGRSGAGRLCNKRRGLEV